MKNDSTVTFLNYVLAALVILCVGFAMLTIVRDHKLPQLAVKATQCNNNFQRLNAVLNEAVVYNATARSPELARILQTASQPKPAAK